ncbi:MAG: homoserine O-acetyltransferase [Abditibacteriota bacterium]|nr:homoserine O-acetyltransferase [Abditibacteriota bacterium]
MTDFNHIETKYITFDKPLPLESGAVLPEITLAYETYGELNEDKSNAILVFHALTGDAHAAGRHTPEDRKPGWWDPMIGPGKAFDTDKYFVICANTIGGCMGSTGPVSINPKTGKRYGSDFPIVTIGDMVAAQKMLIDHMGIGKLFCVVGGSMGGMMTLQWAKSYPERTGLVIPIATTAHMSAQGIAFDAVGRTAVMSDPNWNNGDYYDGEGPENGLAVARMIAHITYMSKESMRQKFGRRLQNSSSLRYDHENDFRVENYLEYQGGIFVKRFDANSYICVTKALDYFDLAQPSGDLRKELAPTKDSPFLIISISSDWLCPTEMSKEIASALRRTHLYISYAEMDSDYGHDAFLVETDSLTNLIGNFLSMFEKK